MQFGRIISVLRPGGGHRQIILLEDVLPVVQGQRATILWDRIDRIAQGHLAPGPGYELILHVVGPIWGQIDE